MQRCKLDDEAASLAKRELAKAEAENKPNARARWLELLGDNAAAATAWEQAGRKERAVPLYEKLGDLPKAAQLAEESKLRDKAIELYEKLGDAAGVERAKAIEVPAAKPVPSAEDKDDAEADEAAAAAETPEPPVSGGEPGGASGAGTPPSPS
jgi:hypothetical protein